MVWSSNLSDLAEVFMPRSFDVFAMLNDDSNQSGQRSTVKPYAIGNSHLRTEPKFCLAILRFRVNMYGLARVSFV